MISNTHLPAESKRQALTVQQTCRTSTHTQKVPKAGEKGSGDRGKTATGAFWDAAVTLWSVALRKQLLRWPGWEQPLPLMAAPGAGVSGSYGFLGLDSRVHQEHEVSSRQCCQIIRQEALVFNVRFVSDQTNFKSSHLQLSSCCISQAMADPSPRPAFLQPTYAKPFRFGRSSSG